MKHHTYRKRCLFVWWKVNRTLKKRSREGFPLNGRCSIARGATEFEAAHCKTVGMLNKMVWHGYERLKSSFLNGIANVLSPFDQTYFVSLVFSFFHTWRKFVANKQLKCFDWPNPQKIIQRPQELAEVLVPRQKCEPWTEALCVP